MEDNNRSRVNLRKESETEQNVYSDFSSENIPDNQPQKDEYTQWYEEGYNQGYNKGLNQRGGQNGQNQDNQAFAIVSLVLGIISIAFSCCALLGSIIGAIAIGFGIASKRMKAGGSGMATAGIVTGAIGFVLGTGWFFLIIIGDFAEEYL